MGLMYIFPVSDEETERTEITTDKDGKKTIIIKTYGLPMIFWGYLAACLIVLASMWLASRSAIDKLLSYQDPTLQMLGFLVQYTLILTPIILLGFFFYEKEIHKSKNIIKIVYKVFYIPVGKKTIVLDSSEALQVDHFMASPNIAKMHNKAELKQFENKGYFELHAKSGARAIFVDRHSRKADLLKIKDLLSRY